MDAVDWLGRVDGWRGVGEDGWGWGQGRVGGWVREGAARDGWGKEGR